MEPQQDDIAVMSEDQGGYCGIRSPHNFDSCSHHDHSTPDLNLRPSPALFSPTHSEESLQMYVIKANGTPVNVFSDEEFVESCSEAEAEPNKGGENDCERVSKMFNKLVGFLLDVEQYLYESENITKTDLLKEVASTRKMLKQNSDLFFDMADFLTSKSGSSNGIVKEKQNDDLISHNLVSVLTEANTQNRVETKESGSSSSSSKENATKKRKTSMKRRSKKRSRKSGNQVSNANSNSENKTAEEGDFIKRRRSTRPRARRSVYFNGEKMYVNSEGELIPLLEKTTEHKENRRKTMETTPDINGLKSNSSQNLSVKRQLYSPDVWLKHINETGINY